MLKTLIKRNGSEEPLIPSKLNGWNEWAAKHLGNRVEWSQAALAAVAGLPEKASTRDLMLKVIDELLAMETYPAYMMAGRLKAVVIRKDLFGSDVCPPIIQLHEKLVSIGLMRKLPYSEADYAEIEQMLDHSRDFHYPEFALKWIDDKYSIRNHVTKERYETPQMMYMRMAMALSENEPVDVRMSFVKRFYDRFSNKKLSSPTPNYLYLGTPHKGLASCCIYTADDDSNSLAIGDLIANLMTVNSAGLGSFTNTRGPGDPIRKGIVEHGGKFRYLKSKAASTLANKQAARAGAGTESFSCYDVEAIDIVQYRNPLQVENKQNRDLHFAMLTNKWFAAKVSNSEEIFAFNSYNAPDLHDAFFSPDIKEFVRLYKQYEADPSFKKKYINARKLLAFSFSEAFDTGTAYLSMIDEANRHTPFKISKNHRIHSANLCGEVFQIQAPYYSVMDLYSKEDHGRGEISMCNLGAIPIENINSDEEYFEAAYLSLKQADYTIYNTSYPFPHLEFTAKQRMNAGIGIMGLATYMARKGMKFSTIEGKKELHRIYERHLYWLIKASIAISKERGLAPWIHKTKWPEGWTPLETYNRGVDTIADFENVYDWAALKLEIIANGGIAHSILSCMMPGESSSKALGSSNAIYPVRSLVISKKDGDNNIVRWAAVDGDLLGDNYEFAFDIASKDHIEHYGIGQKWTDSGISADMYRRFAPGETEVPEAEWVNDFLLMVKVGMKGRYYTNSQRPKVKSMEQAVSLVASKAPVVTLPNADEVNSQVQAAELISRVSDTTLPQAELEYVDTEVEDGCAGGFCKM